MFNIAFHVLPKRPPSRSISLSHLQFLRNNFPYPSSTPCYTHQHRYFANRTASPSAKLQQGYETPLAPPPSSGPPPSSSPQVQLPSKEKSPRFHFSEDKWSPHINKYWEKYGAWTTLVLLAASAKGIGTFIHIIRSEFSNDEPFWIDEAH